MVLAQSVLYTDSTCVWSSDSARGAAVACVWCLRIRNASRTKLTRIMCLDSTCTAQCTLSVSVMEEKKEPVN